MSRLQRLLAPLEVPYALAVVLKNLAYDRSWRRARELGWPVVSVGNLSVGGAGKTPFVIELAALLGARGLHPDVLSRGYRRRSPQAVERVVADGDPARFGDEPLLLTRATGAPVYVGASRWAAGRLAERDAQQQPGVHLLDDGFQHRKLARTVEIVLLHPSDIEGRLLPAGRLREPIQTLRRADFLILRHDDESTEPALRRAGIHKPVWRVRRVILPPPVDGPVVAFCAIAHPDEFFRSLRDHGFDLRGAFAFPDHHAFHPGELEALAEAGGSAAALLTTEKDLVRLPPAARKVLAHAAPLHAVSLRAELLDAEQCLSSLFALITERAVRK